MVSPIMDEDEIVAALENAAVVLDKATLNPRASVNPRDVQLYARDIMRFLENLDAELTVGEIRSAIMDQV